LECGGLWIALQRDSSWDPAARDRRAAPQLARTSA